MHVINDPAKRSAYYPALDGFRALAVLMVFLLHYIGSELPLMHNWGWMGVDFFFVLSGFLITGILYDSRGRQHRFRDFYARRVLRIFPLYYGVWLALVLLWPVFHWRWSAVWLLWPAHLGNMARFLSFQAGNVVHADLLFSTTHQHRLAAVFMGHFWSLCVEEQFYLVWPMVVLLARSRRVLLVLCTTIVVGEPFLRLLLLNTLPPPLLDAQFLARCTVTRLDSLLIGGLIALLLRGPSAVVLQRYGRLLSVSSLVLFACFLAEHRLRTHTSMSSLTDPVISTFGFSAVALLAGGLILELIRAESPLQAIASFAPLRRLGQVSYGFYVFHDLPHEFYSWLASHLATHRTLGTAAVGFCATLALSLLSFRYFESPFLSLKSRFGGQVHRAPELKALHATDLVVSSAPRGT